MSPSITNQDDAKFEKLRDFKMRFHARFMFQLQVDDWMVDPQPHENPVVETEGEEQPVTVQELNQADEESVIHQDIEAVILEKLKQNVNIVDEPVEPAVEEPGDTPQKVEERGTIEEEEMTARALSDGGVYV